MTFDIGRSGGGNLSGEQVHLIAAKAESADDPRLPSLVNVQELGDFIEQEADNENIVFENASTQTVDGDEATFNYDFGAADRGAGAYVFLAVRTDSGSGVDITNGNIDVDGQVSVLGADTTFVQQTSSDISVNQTPAVGDTIEFEVDSNLNTSNGRVEHVVALWNESNVAGEELTVVAPDNIDSTTTAEDFTVQHTVANVSGVQRTDQDISVFGRSIATNERGGVFGLPDIVSFIANEGNFANPTTERTGETTINASVTAVNVSQSSTTIEVETRDSFNPGEYVAVHLATSDGDLTKLSSSRTDITLTDQDESDESDGGSGGAAPDGPFVEEFTLNDREITTGETVTATVTVRNPTNETVEDTLRLEANGTELDIRDVTISNSSTDANFATVELTASFNTTGSRTLTVSGNTISSDPKDVSVVPPVERTFSISQSDLDVGESFDVTVDVTNNQRTEATIPVEVTGVSDEQRNFTVPGETTETRRFEFSYSSPGSREVSLNEVSRTVDVTVARPTAGLIVTPNPTDPAAGEDVTISVERTDSDQTVDNVTLKFTPPNGETVTEQDVSTPFTRTFNQSGTYEVTATDAIDRDAVNLTQGVAEFTVREPANLSLQNARTPFSEVRAGEDVVARVDVQNTGESAGEQTLLLKAGEANVTERTVTVQPGTQTVSLQGPVTPTGTELPESQDLTIERLSSDDTVEESEDAGSISVISPFETAISVGSQTVNQTDGVSVNLTLVDVGTNNAPENLTQPNVSVQLGDETVSNTFDITPGGDDTQTYTFEEFDQTGDLDLTITSTLEDPITRPGVVTVTDDPVVNVGLEANATAPEAGTPIELTVSAATDTEFEATIEAIQATGEITETVTTEGGTATLTLDEPGGYTIETTGHGDLEDGNTIDPGVTSVFVRERGDIVVRDATVATPSVARTETATVRAVVVNTGETEVTENISIQGQTNPGATETVTLGGGERDIVALTTAFETRGIIEDVTVETDDPDGASVVAGDIEVTPALTVTDVRIPNRFGSVTDDVTVEVDVTNRGPQIDAGNVTRNITVNVAGTTTDTLSQSAFNGTDAYDPEETNTLTFRPESLTPVDEPGSRTITVDNEQVRQIFISRQAVDLSLDVRGNQTVGENVTFEVTTAGEPVDATVQLPDRSLSTGSDGVVNATFDDAVDGTARAVKQANETSFFVSDTTALSVIEPADIVVTSATVNTTQRFAGEPVGVTVVAVNRGGERGSQTIAVNTTDDDELATRTVELDPGERRTVELTPTLSEPGATTLDVAGETTQTVLVDEAVALTETSVPSAVVAGDEFTIDVTLEDRVTDTPTSSREISVTVGNETASETVTPPDGGTTTESFSFTLNDTGSVEATRVVNDTGEVSIGEIEVATETVPLNLATTPEPATVTAGESVTFDVTANETPEEATIRVAGQTIRTNESGTAQTTIPIAGNFTATATKGGTTGTGYVADTAPVNVSDPITATLSENFTAVEAGPAQGSQRTADSIERELTIQNTGGRAVAISGLGVTGADGGQYRLASTPPTSVAAGSSETVTVAFEPTVRRNTDATLRFRTDTPRTPVRTLSLNGTGVSPDVSVNTTSLPFGAELTDGDPPVNETVQVSNDGNRPLSVSPATGDESFTVTPGRQVIQPGGSQDYTVEFDPADTSPQEFGDVLTLSTNDTFEPTVTVPLTATIDQGNLTVGTTTAAVGELAVGNTTTESVVVSNTGTDTIETVTTTNETTANELSVVSTSEVGSLEPGEQQLVDIRLRQEATASSAEAEVTFEPGEPLENRTITLIAEPTAPRLSTEPSVDGDTGTTELNFGELSVGSTTTRDVTVTNTGDATLQLSNLAVNGSATAPFLVSGTSRDLTVPAGESQSITVAFNPQQPAEFTDADLEFEWNNANVDGTTTVSADLRGKGTRTALTGTPSTVRFDTIGAGATTQDTVTVTNDGNTALTVTGTSVSGTNSPQFESELNSDITLEPGTEETVPVTYAPTQAAAHGAQLTILTNTTSGFTATLEGEATPPDIQLDDQSLEFGFVNAESGETATASTLIENTGRDGTSLDITDVTLIGNDPSAFTITETPTQGGEDLSVQFAPEADASGERTAEAVIRSNDPDESRVTVPLRGVATRPELTNNRSGRVTFGTVPTTTASERQLIGITNTGGTPATITDTTLDSTANFTLMAGVNGTLVPGDTAVVAVRAEPTDTGSVNTNLTVSREEGATEQITLTATGVAPNATVTDDISGEFGGVGISSSTTQTLTIQNDGDATLTLTNISATSDAFQVVGTQETTSVAADETADITVAFNPSSAGSASGTLSVDTNDNARTIERSLNGNGETADTAINQSSVDFGGVSLDTETTENLRLENTGGDQLNITGVSISGPGVSAFDVNGFESTALAADETETFTVTANPTVAQGRTAQLSITTATSGEDVSVALGVTGETPEFDVSQQEIRFDRTRLGETSTETLELQNTGNSPLDIRNVLVSGTSSDQFTVDTASATIPPKATQTVDVQFTPAINETAAKEGTPQTATISLQSNDPNQQSLDVSLTGQSKTPELETANLIRYGTLRVGQQTTQQLELSNAPTATANIEIDELTLLGTDASEFSVSSLGDTTIEPGESRTVDVSVTPRRGGTKSASLLVTTTDPRESRTSVSLSNSRTVVIVRYGSVTFEYTGITTVDPKFKSSNDPNTGVIGMDPVLNTVTDFNMTFSTRASGAGPELGDQVSATPVRYLGVETSSLSSGQHNETEVQFKVAKSTISDLESVEDGITLYQYDGSEYVALQTDRLPGKDTDTEYAYSASMGNLNDLAIGAGQPNLQLSSAAVRESTVPDTLEAGNSATVTIDVAIENSGSVAGSDTISVDDPDGVTLANPTETVNASETKTVEVPVELTGPGSRELTVNVAGETETVSVDIGQPPEPGEDPGDGTDSATVDESGQAAFGFDPDGSQGITGATITLPDGVPQGTTVDISTSANPTGGAEDRGSGAIYLNISPGTSVSSSTDISVDVQQSTLDSFDNPSLYRYDGSNWNELDTSVSGNTITATSPNGLSPFAIDEATDDTGTEDDDTGTSSSGGGGGGGGGSLIADFLATNLDSSTTEVTQGDAITVSAELESDGIVQDTQDVDLRIGGETIATQSVELSSGATTTVEFTDVTVDVDPGEYEYGIYTDADSVTGTITVVADETADEEATADEPTDEEAADEEGTADEPADDATDDGIPGFGLVVALIALVAAALLAARRRDT